MGVVDGRTPRARVDRPTSSVISRPRGGRKRPVTVLVSGFIGAGNVGDEAIFHVLSGRLRDDAIDVHALSIDPAATRAMHGVRSWHRITGLLPALRGCDVLVSGGGGLLQDRTSARSLAYYLGVIRLARLMGKRVIVYGQSLGPLSERGRRHAASALRGIPVAVRDERSLQLAAELNVRATVADDPALLLTYDRTEPFVHPADLPSTLALIPREDVPSATEAMQRLAREERSAGRRVVVGCLDRDDAHAATTIADAAGTGVVHVRAPGDARGLLRDVGTVVSVRLHGSIFAAGARIPHVGIAYDPKVTGFLARSRGVSVPVPVTLDAVRKAVEESRATATTQADATVRLVESARSGLDALVGMVHTVDGDGARAG